MPLKFKPKSLNQQVIVITGAASGVGPVLSKMAVAGGARVILADKNEHALEDLCEHLSKTSGSVVSIKTDETRRSEMSELSRKALEQFDHIDTWINLAGASLSGYLLETDINDEKKIFDSNFWGTRYGSEEAVKALSDRGGVLINMGSEVSVGAQPLQGIYAASKEAVKTFTNALRSELRDKDMPIEVCLVKPMSSESEAHEATASAILKCAQNPQRDIFVGGPARLSAILDTFFPTVKDMMTENKLKELKSSTH